MVIGQLDWEKMDLVRLLNFLQLCSFYEWKEAVPHLTGVVNLSININITLGTDCTTTVMSETENSEKITLYFSTVPGNNEMRKGQQEIESALQANKIDYEIKDVAASTMNKVKMRSFANDRQALPPQIVNKHHYCGDYKGFQAAMETKTLGEFLKLERKLDLSI